MVRYDYMYDHVNEYADNLQVRYKDNNLTSVSKYCTVAYWTGSNQKEGDELDACQLLPIKLPYPGIGSWPDCPSPGAAATIAMACTNPGRSDMDFPAFLYELREVPDLLRVAGSTLLRAAAGVNLAYQFGWKPLVADVNRLFDFTTSMKKRKAEFERLGSGDGLRRRVTVYNGTQEDTDESVALETQVLFAHAERKTVRTRQVWVTIRWRPRVDTFPDVPDKLNELIRDSLLGLRKGQITSQLWEAVPWSWLVDWFSNFQEFLVAGDQDIAYVSEKPNVMTYTRSVSDYRLKGDHPSWAYPTTSLLSATRIDKSRDVVDQPSLEFMLPPLTGRQLSILGSLSILRKGR